MPYVRNPLAGEFAQPDQIWEDDGPPGQYQHAGHATFMVALIGLALMPWLYPLLTGAALAVAFVGEQIADGMGLSGLAYAGLTAAPALVVFVLGMRIEQRLGTFAPYRWLRHVLRVAAPALLLYVMVGDEMGTPGGSSFLGGAIAVMAIAQVALWAAGWVRTNWHASLRAMRMRAESLDD
ncbi:MAG: hypothetical protein ABI880_13875 [Acidobacteriota bacterium]